MRWFLFQQEVELVFIIISVLYFVKVCNCFPTENVSETFFQEKLKNNKAIHL